MVTWPIRTILLYLFIFILSSANTRAQLYVEAESFATKGGWVVDQQSMDEMGSAYLMAHGLGDPVADAVHDVAFPDTGTYHIYVRTRDWVSPYGPGAFRLAVNGTQVDTVFGMSGNGAWAWAYGGTATIDDTNATLVLRDSTGFNGRCDAVYFTKDSDDVPPNGIHELAAFRRTVRDMPGTPPLAGEYGLVVVGGGIAGVCAAVSAARQGVSVALIHNRPVLGGNNSSDVRVRLQGEANLDPFPSLGDIVNELDPGYNQSGGTAAGYDDAKKQAVVDAEDNISLFLSRHVYACDTAAGKITAVYARHIETGEEHRYRGVLFADCTGDGNLGYMAGADFRYGRESRAETGESKAPELADSLTMGSTNLWSSVDAGEPSPFPACPWALQFTEDYYYAAEAGAWYWESGFHRHTVGDAEYIRDHNLRAVFGNWAFLKNASSRAAEYADRKLSWMAHISGKRESRRLLGDVILSQQDIQDTVVYPDACVPVSWYIDLHLPRPACTRYFPGEEFIGYMPDETTVIPARIPFRCLYSRNIGNLFMAGRCISVTHVALGAVRVMRTTGMMGEAVGYAAALCGTYGILPRELYENRLPEYRRLLGLDERPETIVDNRDADTVGAWTVSTHTDGYYGTDYFHDGNTAQGTKRITFTPSLSDSGEYDLYLRWTDGANRAGNVPVYVNHATGSDTLTVDMRTGGGQWFPLGTYSFNAGTEGTVTLTNEGTGGYVIADAVRWVYDGDTTATTAVAAGSGETAPRVPALYAAPDGSVRYRCMRAGPVRLTVADMAGRTTTLVNGTRTPGTYRISTGNGLRETGLYVFTLNTGGSRYRARLLVMP